MARPRADGKPPRPTIKIRLTDKRVKDAKAHPTERTLIYDNVPGFCLQIEASGHKAYKLRYVFFKRKRTFHIGAVDEFKTVDDARALAYKLILEVKDGKDPQADRAVQRCTGTYKEHVALYLEWKIGETPKSFNQVEDYLGRMLPTWGSVPTASIDFNVVDALYTRRKNEHPATARNLISHLSGLFSFLIRKKLIPGPNPCHDVQRKKPNKRTRVMQDSEFPLFWSALDHVHPVRARALKALLFTGQRSSEITHMRFEHIAKVTLQLTKDQRDALSNGGREAPESVSGHVWQMPGQPSKDWDHHTKQGTWPGTKTGADHEIWLPRSVMALIGEGDHGFVFADKRGGPCTNLPSIMRRVCAAMGLTKGNYIVPHDLRRTHGTRVRSVGFSRAQMDAIQNHSDGGVGSIYDQWPALFEFWQIQTRTTKRLLELAKPTGELSHMQDEQNRI